MKGYYFTCLSFQRGVCANGCFVGGGGGGGGGGILSVGGLD